MMGIRQTRFDDAPSAYFLLKYRKSGGGWSFFAGIKRPSKLST